MSSPVDLAQRVRQLLEDEGCTLGEFLRVVDALFEDLRDSRWEALSKVLDSPVAGKARRRSPHLDRLLTVDEAAQYVSTTAAAIYKAVERRRIPVVRNGRHLRFRLTDLEKAFPTEQPVRRRKTTTTFRSGEERR